MKGMVSDLYHTKYVALDYSDLTKAEILEKIRSMVNNSFDESVTLFYYSGHGLYSADESKLGALYAIDGNYITFKQLATELSKIKGRVIVILDSCYSGASIKSVGGSAEDSLDTFNDAAIEAFSGYSLDSNPNGIKSGELKQSKFIVITASAYNHASYATGKPGYDGNGYQQSAFTAAIIKGMGRKYPIGAKINRYGNKEPADKNEDGKVTLWEIYSYANSTARSWTSKNGDPQRAKYYGPEGEVLFW